MIRTSLLALAATAAFASQAMATPELTTVSTRVSYADLDMNSPQGVAALNKRIHTAARSVCGDPPGNDLREIGNFSRCVHEAVINAVELVRSPQLSAMNGGSKPFRLARR